MSHVPHVSPTPIVKTAPRIRSAYLRTIQRLEAHPRRRRAGVTLDEIDAIMQPSDGVAFVHQVITDLVTTGKVKPVSLMHWHTVK